MTESENIKRIVFLGEKNSGKTTLIKRLLNNASPTYPTQGIDLNIYKTNQYKYFLWDTSGDDKYKFIINSYISRCDLIIIVYDSSDLESVINLKNTLVYIKNLNENIKIITLNNKFRFPTQDYRKHKSRFNIEEFVIFDTDVEPDIKHTFSKIFDVFEDSINIDTTELKEITEEKETNCKWCCWK